MVTTLAKLRTKTANLSNYVPYELTVNKEPRKDVCWLYKSYGVEGGDVLFVGTANECESFLLGMEEMLLALS